MHRPSGQVVFTLAALGYTVAICAAIVEGTGPAAPMIAGLVTLAAVVWTAFETAVLRIETTRQTEISIRPHVVVTAFNDFTVTLLNVGHGAALNVSVPLQVLAVEGEGEFTFAYEMAAGQVVPFLLPSTTSELSVIATYRHPDIPPQNASLERTGMVLGLATRPFIVSYSDVLGARYHCEHVMRGGQLIAIRARREVG